jgi:GTPase
MSFSLAIVGRPNVGKSTLFNRLVGKRLALVDDRPGVTRDLREGVARLGPLRFTVIDTAGLEDVTDDSLPGRMRRLTERAVEMADICLFVIDARVGVVSADEVFAEILRKRAKRVILAANKSEGRAGEGGALEAWALGLGEPLRISAEHGEGMEDLYSVLAPMAEEYEARAVAEAPVTGVRLKADPAEGDEEGGIGGADETEDEAAAAEAAWRPTLERPLQVAIVGRPNAGKSTLVNAILGEDRMLTGPEAGITRDAISITTEWMGTPMRIFDPAGMRRKAKVVEKLEKMSVADGLRATRFAEVVVVLLDAAIPFETQDLRIADLAETEGRAVVIAVNKWDLEDDKQDKLKALLLDFETSLPQLRGAPLVTVSAKTGRGLDRLHDAIVKAHAVWNRRITTSQLNRWLGAMIESHPPPAPGGRRIRIRYVTQVKTRPPAFVAMCSAPEVMPDSYIRYLVNGLREAFDMPGTPIRFVLRGQGDKNPWKDRKSSQPSKLKKHMGTGPRQGGPGQGGKR